MKTLITLFLSVFIIVNAHGQTVKQKSSSKPKYVYSSAQLRDFADAAFYQYKFGTNRMFKILIDRAFVNKGYTTIDAAVAVESITTDKQGREIIFLAFAEQFRTADLIAKNIYSIGTSAKTARDIANYIYQNYSNESSGD